MKFNHLVKSRTDFSVEEAVDFSLALDSLKKEEELETLAEVSRRWKTVTVLKTNAGTEVGFIRADGTYHLSWDGFDELSADELLVLASGMTEEDYVSLWHRWLSHPTRECGPSCAGSLDRDRIRAYNRAIDKS